MILLARSSFLKLSDWMFELELHCKVRMTPSSVIIHHLIIIIIIIHHLILCRQEEPVRLLLGNKSDLEARREVEKAEAAEFARTHNMVFLETSALMSHEVEYAFEVQGSD